jgi:hypothetical protein
VFEVTPYIFNKTFRKKNVLIVAVLLGLVSSVFFIILSYTSSKDDYFKSVLYSIEESCADGTKQNSTESEDNYYAAFYYSNRCLHGRLALALEEVDPLEAAGVVFSMYGSPSTPFVTSRCHSIVHEIGRKAAESDTPIPSSSGSLELCSSAFLHGYYERSMELLTGSDFIESGFTNCIELASYKGAHQDCAHTYGHLLYSKNSSAPTKAAQLEAATLCFDIEYAAQFTCLNGFFMDLFGDLTYVDMVLSKQLTTDINKIIDLCFSYENPQIRESCVLMSWYLLYAFFEKHVGSAEAVNYVIDSCSYINSELEYSCGMMLGFMFFHLYPYDAKLIGDACSSLRNESDYLADGCLIWSARTLWRQTYDDKDFTDLCDKVSSTRQNECELMWRYINEV